VKGSEFKSVDSDMTGKIGREAEVVREIGATLAVPPTLLIVICLIFPKR